MRVLLVTDKSLPQRGGSQMLLHNVYSRFPADSVTMLSRSCPGDAEFDPTAGYAVERVPFLGVPKLRMPLLWARLRMAAPGLARRIGADQIHCGQAFETGWIGLLCKRRLGIPYLVHTYLEEITIYRRNRLTRRIIERALTQADAVTTISRFGRQQLLDLGVSEQRIYLIYPGVTAPEIDAERVAAVRRRYKLEGRAVLLTVGRLAPRKGHDRVIEALTDVARSVPSVIYLIVGSGPERQRLERLAQSAGVADRVVFTGPVDDLGAFYGAADVFITANRELPNGDVEGFGIVFLEAGAAGLPVVGGRSGGTGDAVADGETGLLVDPENWTELAGAIAQLLCDRDLALRMGRAGRERVAAEFTWEKAASATLAVAEVLTKRT